MNWSNSTSTSDGNSSRNKKFKGVRQRKWGKYVSEIRVPGSQERLWLGTYATPEAAAVAHDVAVYCLKRPSTLEKLNFPEVLSSYCIQHRDRSMSPRSVQKVASDVAMDVDARNIASEATTLTTTTTTTTTLDQSHHVHNVVADDDVCWWEGLGDDQGMTQVSSQQQEGLSISIEDYL